MKTSVFTRVRTQQAYWRALLAVVFMTASSAGHAVNCQFIPISGAWEIPGNWANCVGGNGTPANTPGPADRAEIVAKTAILPAGNFPVADLFLQDGTVQGAAIGATTLSTTTPVFTTWGGTQNNISDLTLNFGNGFSVNASATITNIVNAALVTNSGTTTIGPATISGSGAKIQMTGGTAYNAAGNHTMTGGAIFQNSSGVFRPNVSLLVDGPFVNGGNIEIPTGVTLSLADATQMSQTSPAFSLFFGNGTLSAPGQTLSLPLGGVRGPGLTFNVGTLQNSGAVLRPFNAGIGVLTINGNYVQSGTGSLEFQLNGTAPTQYDRLLVSGTVDFNYSASQPKVGFVWTTPVPNINDFYDVISYGARNGNLDFIGSTAGRSLAISYPPGVVRVTAVSSTLGVTNTADSGPGSLRDALMTILADTGCLQAPYDVRFLTAGTIQPLSQLPAINCATKVTGQFVPGAQPNTSTSDWNASLPLTLDGGACGGACSGLVFNAPGSKVYGVNFANWGSAGVQINGSATNMLVHGNYFFQGGRGVSHVGALDVRIGETGTLFARNVFVHATIAGIASTMQSGGAPLRVENNLIGAGAGFTPGPNVKGIDIAGTSNAVIAENVIANNTKGLVVVVGTGNLYDGNNKIYSNGTAVDLGDDGPSANDEMMPPYDTDTGPNQRLNFPTITSLTPTSGTSATVNYEVKSGAGASIHVFFCRNPGGSAQCEQLIAGTPISTDANGFFAGNFGIGGLVPGTPVTMFARADSGPKVGNMSEISPSVNFVLGAPAVTISGSGAFPATNVGSSSGVQTISIQNSGTANLDISAINMTPSGTFVDTSGGPSPNASHYCLFGSDAIGTPLTGAPKTLIPGQSCSINFIFKPTVGGPVNHTLQVVSNASTSPDSLALTGTGNGTVSMTVAFAPTAVAPGANATMTLTLTNPNAVAASISAGSVTIPAGLTATPPGTNSCGTFGSVGGGVYSFGMGSIPGSGSCTIDLTVSSPTPSTYTVTIMPGALSAGSSNSNTSSNTLTVTASPPPAITLTPPSVVFGARTVNTTSPVSTVTLANSGGAPLTITSITPNGDFAVVTVCPLGPATLGVGLNCPLDITFTPLTVSAALTGSVTIISNAPGSPHVVPLSGAGTSTPVPVVNLSTTGVNFANQLIGTTSAIQTINVYNSGFATLFISSITKTGSSAFTRVIPAGPGPGPLNFIEGIAPVAPSDCGTNVAPGGSCTISVVFSPTAAGPATAQINIATNAGGSPHIVNLIGTGISTAVPTISVANNISFGDQIIGAGGTQTLNITNSGSAPMTVSSIAVSGANASNFVTSGTCTTVDAGANCAIVITFTPTSVGAKTALITIVSDASNLPTATLGLTGNGILAPRPIVDLSATTIGYGNAIFGGASAGQIITLKNTGGASLQIQNLFTSGDFVVMNSCPAVLASGSACVINVTFSPLGTGQRTGELVVISNALGSPHRIPLSGTGCRWFSQAQRGFFLTICG